MWFFTFWGDGAVTAPGPGSSTGVEVRTTTQIDVWSNLQCAGGVRVALSIPVLSCMETQELSDGFAGSRLNLEFPASWERTAEVTPGRVIRLTYPDDTFDEFRVDNVDERIPKDTVTVSANGVIFDLAMANALISETTGQRVDYNVSKIDVPSSLLDFVLGFGPSYITRGTVTPTPKVSVTFDWATPLTGAQAISAATKAYDGITYDLWLSRNGILGYTLNLTLLNSAAPAPYLRTGKNLLRITKKTLGQEVVNRVYPQIPWSDQAGIGEHLFVVSAVSANTYIAIDDPALRGINPIAEDDALNGLYWIPYNEAAGTATARLITDTERATRRLYMADTTGIAVGDQGRIAKTSAKAFLGYVDKPSTQGAGLRVLRLTVPETAIDNVLTNPSLSRWTGGQLDYWYSTGTVWPDEESNVVFTGIRSARFQNHPSIGNYYQFGVKAWLWTARPNLKLKYRVWYKNLQNADSTGVAFRFEAIGDAGLTTIFNSTQVRVDWTAITTDEFNVVAGARRSIEVRISNGGISSQTTARVYVGAVEALIYESGFALPTGPILGSNSTNAWLRGVSTLTADPVTYEVSIADLTRADATRWPFDAVVLGGTANLRDADSGLATSLRIVGLTKDHLNPLSSKVTFTKLVDTLTALVVSG